MKTKKIPIALILSSIFIILLIYFGSAIYIFFTFKDFTKAGQFGDLFGAVNALFSAFALTGIILTIYLQSRELEYQREELELTRNEIKGQRVEMEKQSEIFEFQRFENNYFNLLKALNETTSNLNIEKYNDNNDVFDIIAGKKCFTYFLNEFEEEYKHFSKNSGSEIDSINDAFYAFFNKEGANIGHYFRLFYNIVKYIDQSKILDKQFYMNIMRAHLCSHELFMIFYNGLSQYGSRKFKPLIEKYALLEGFDTDLLLNSQYISIYAQSAYKEI